jgi:hypothetical protein
MAIQSALVDPLSTNNLIFMWVLILDYSPELSGLKAKIDFLAR